MNGLQSSVDPFAKQALENRKYFSIGLALLVVALLLGLVGAGMLGVGKAVNGAMTQTLGRDGGGLTRATGKNGPPLTQATGDDRPATMAPQEAKYMPKDVLDWLKHLEKCERMRNELVGSQIADMAPLKAMLGLGGVGPGDFLDPEKALDEMPTGKALKKTGDAAKPWDDLDAFFNSKKPPEECFAIRNAYEQALGETKNSIVSVNDALASVEQSGGDEEKAREQIQKLRKLMESNKAAIDAPGKYADELVQQVCDKYGVQKWFSIKEDIGGGFGGILGGLGGK